MVDYTSKNVNETWDEMNLQNNTACTMDDAINLTKQYALAGTIMLLVLLSNLCSYIVGVIISNPTWVDQIVDKYNKDIVKYRDIDNRKRKYILTSAEENKKYDELKPKLPEIKRKMIFFKVFRNFTKLLWPFLIVLPHEFLTGIEWCIFSIISHTL